MRGRLRPIVVVAMFALATRMARAQRGTGELRLQITDVTGEGTILDPFRTVSASFIGPDLLRDPPSAPPGRPGSMRPSDLSLDYQAHVTM